MKISKKLNDFAYFIFPLINGMKKLLYFLYFKFMITLLVICLLTNIFLGSLVNDAFSNLKSNVFIITGFILSKKYVKQVLFILQKMGA